MSRSLKISLILTVITFTIWVISYKNTVLAQTCEFDETIHWRKVICPEGKMACCFGDFNKPRCKKGETKCCKKRKHPNKNGKIWNCMGGPVQCVTSCSNPDDDPDDLPDEEDDSSEDDNEANKVREESLVINEGATNTETKTNESTLSIGFCGDGSCTQEEFDSGNCTSDCSDGVSFCGDGICKEKEKGWCNSDCNNLARNREPDQNTNNTTTTQTNPETLPPKTEPVQEQTQETQPSTPPTNTVAARQPTETKPITNTQSQSLQQQPPQDQEPTQQPASTSTSSTSSTGGSSTSPPPTSPHSPAQDQPPSQGFLPPPEEQPLAPPQDQQTTQPLPPPPPPPPKDQPPTTLQPALPPPPPEDQLPITSQPALPPPPPPPPPPTVINAVATTAFEVGPYACPDNNHCNFTPGGPCNNQFPVNGIFTRTINFNVPNDNCVLTIKGNVDNDIVIELDGGEVVREQLGNCIQSFPTWCGQISKGNHTVNVSAYDYGVVSYIYVKGELRCPGICTGSTSAFESTVEPPPPPQQIQIAPE